MYIGKGRKDDRSIIVIPVMSSGGNIIENLLLLNIAFKKNVALDVKIKALGGKYEHIKNIVQENSIEWHDRLIETVEMDELFGLSAEKIGERIVSQLDETPTRLTMVDRQDAVVHRTVSQSASQRQADSHLATYFFLKPL